MSIRAYHKDAVLDEGIKIDFEEAVKRAISEKNSLKVAMKCVLDG